MIRTLAIATAVTLFAAPAFAQTTEMSPAPHAMGSMKPDHGTMGHSMKSAKTGHSMKSDSMKSDSMKSGSMSHDMKSDSMKGDSMKKPSPAPR